MEGLEVDRVERLLGQPQGQLRDRLGEERLTRLEVVHERALGDARALGDPPGRQPAVARPRRGRRRCAWTIASPRGGPLLGAGDTPRPLTNFVDHVIEMVSSGTGSPISRSTNLTDDRTSGQRQLSGRREEETQGDPWIRFRRAASMTGAAAGVAAREATARAIRLGAAATPTPARRRVAAAAQVGGDARQGAREHARRRDEGRADALGGRPRSRPGGDPPAVPGDPVDAATRRRAGARSDRSRR